MAVKHVIKKNVEIDRNLKKALQIRKELNHDNITRFIGACVETPHVYILTNYCARGSLKVILLSYYLYISSSMAITRSVSLLYGMLFSFLLAFHILSRTVIKLSENMRHQGYIHNWKTNRFFFVSKMAAMETILRVIQLHPT